MIRSLSENKDSENDESVDSQIINPNRENMESWREETKDGFSTRGTDEKDCGRVVPGPCN